ncbi:MAG: M48 family metallopeptidase [Planctomycetes bacterium]|nr:M48 family metallopeptidase [Planctomycetota bacterium]
MSSPTQNPRRRGSLADKARADEQIREHIRAYPGSITYLDLIRKNKRDSVLLIAGMLALGLVLGGVIGGAVGGYAGADIMGSAQGRYTAIDLLPSIVLGAIVAFLFAAGGALWSYRAGANAILRMAHAREVTRELDQELFNVVDEMRIAAGIPMPRIYIIGDTALNAFATGRDPEHAVVAITTGLRQKLTRDELQGVIAHEIAHIRHYDIRFSLLMATMVGLIVFACDAFLRATWYGAHARGRGRRSSGGGKGQIVLLVLALVLAIVAPLIARLIQMAYSRQREYLADAGAVELSRNPEGLASALSRLSMDEEPLVDTANRGTAHMYIVNPLRKMRASHNQLNSRFSSHPPVKQRIARLLALTR